MSDEAVRAAEHDKLAGIYGAERAHGVMLCRRGEHAPGAFLALGNAQVFQCTHDSTRLQSWYRVGFEGRDPKELILTLCKRCGVRL